MNALRKDLLVANTVPMVIGLAGYGAAANETLDAPATVAPHPRARNIALLAAAPLAGLAYVLAFPIIGPAMMARHAIRAYRLNAAGATTKNAAACIGSDSGILVRSNDRDEFAGAIELLNKKSGSGFVAEEQAILEKGSDHFRSNVDRVFPNRQAVRMGGTLVTFARNAIIAGVVGVGGMGFVLSLLHAAVLSRFE